MFGLLFGDATFVKITTLGRYYAATALDVAAWQALEPSHHNLASLLVIFEN